MASILEDQETSFALLFFVALYALFSLEGEITEQMSKDSTQETF